MLEALQSPIKIKKLEIRNRVVLPPMVTNFAADTGGVTRQLIEYHAERAKGGVGLQIVESTQIGPEPTGRLRINSDSLIPGLNELAESIKMWGSKPGVQLNYGGGRGPDPLSPDQISGMVEDFASAALRAQMAGFDLVEIHAAHTSVLGQFLSPRSNHRTDDWGGSFENRVRLPLAVIRRVREKVGNGFPLSLRINGDEFIERGKTIEETERMVPLFEKEGIDVLHVSGGGAESKEWTGLPMAFPRGALVHLAERVKKCVTIPVITVGRINDPLLADRIIREGKADLVSFGRALFADPYLPKKAFLGKLDEIRKCTACNDCRMRVADFTWKVKCSVNANLGKEGTDIPRKAETRKKVMVIGGGPAGMEAARIAKMRGHSVTLYEKNKKVGGQLTLAVLPPHKEELNNLLEYLSNQMKSLKIPVKLGLEVNSSLIQKARPDAIILATGSRPAVPPFEGHAKTLTSYEILRGKLPKGESFLIIGGGSVGCEIAEYLAEKGKKVSVVEILGQIACDAQSDGRKLLAQRLREKKVDIYTCSQVQRIEGEKITLVNHEGKTLELQADAVVVAAGSVSTPISLKGTEKLKPYPEIYLIGDCRQPGKIMQAIHDGNRVGQVI